MGQAIAVAGVLSIGAAGAYKLVESLQGNSLRLEPRHAPGILEAEQARLALDAAAEHMRLQEEQASASAPSSCAGQSELPEKSEHDCQDGNASTRQSATARMVGELRALREQAERKRREQAEQVAEQQRQPAQEEPVRSEQLKAEPTLKPLNLEGLRGKCTDVQSHAREEARRRYPRPSWLHTRGCINVAVTGNAGVGKSSFINTIRALRARDEGAADVSPNETTMQPTCYDYPGLPVTTKLWDLPGAGTQRFPREGYIQSMGLRYFDVVIIVTASRYTETEVMIADELQKFRVPHFMVRNKLDSDVENNKDDHDIAPESTLAMIREEMQRQGVTQPYLVSSKFSRRDEFELNQLKEDALQAICDAREVSQDWVQTSPRERIIQHLPTPARALHT